MKRPPKVKDNEIKIWYGQIDKHSFPDICFNWGKGLKGDALLLCDFVTFIEGYNKKTLKQELIDRGYDITTLKISIQKK